MSHDCRNTIDLLIDGGDDALLESHLCECGRCRSLAEVLSPLHEARVASSQPPVEEFAFSLQDTPSASAIQIAEQSASRLGGLSDSSARTEARPFLSQLKYAAAFLAGVAASIGCMAALQSEQNTNFSTSDSVCLWGTEFTSNDSETELVRSCVACHLVSN